MAVSGHGDIYGGDEGLRHHLCVSHGEHLGEGASREEMEDLHEDEHPYGGGAHRGEWGCYEHDPSDEPTEFHDMHEAGGIGDIHRGIGVSLPDRVHRVVHDESRPVHERAEALLGHVSDHPGHLGMHWTTESRVAENFAERSAQHEANEDQRGRYALGDFSWGHEKAYKDTPLGKPGTAVVFHSHEPSLDAIESDGHRLSNGGAYGWSQHGEREVPIRDTHSLDLKGISWAPMHSDDEVPGHGEYTHHDFGSEHEHTAAVVAGQDENGEWFYGAKPAHLADDLPAEMHRGVGMYLPQDLHDHLRDESAPAAVRARALMKHMDEHSAQQARYGDGGLGIHWSGKERAALGFATRYDSTNHKLMDFVHDPRVTRVVLHAQTADPSQMLRSKRKLDEHEIFGINHGEGEIPLKKRSRVHLNGISWGVNEEDAPLTRYDFPEPVQRSAGTYVAPAEGEGEMFRRTAARDDGDYDHEVPAAERTESVRHMLDHYKPYDFPTWQEVSDNSDWHHPVMRAFVDHVRQHGVQRPIPVDYEQDPPQVRNGHTRLLAAERAGVTHVPTRQHQGWVDPDDEPDLPRLLEGHGPKEAALLGHFEAADDDYHMRHRPGGEDYGAPFHDVEDMMPGYHDHRPSLYDNHARAGEPWVSNESDEQLRHARGNPEADVNIYRALPREHREINSGDWVSSSASYARQHAESNLHTMPWAVIKSTVKAKHLFTEGDMNEWGYHGPDISGAKVHVHGGPRRKQAAVRQRESDERAYGDYTMRYRTDDLGERKPRHVIEAHTPDGTRVGELNWYGTTGTVHHIGVAGPEDEPGGNWGDGRDHRRRGLASAMWDWGQEMTPKPKHSKDQTNQGKDWVRGLKNPRKNPPSLPDVVAHFEAVAADEPGVTVEHEERPSGGSAYPRMHTLTATHPDGTAAELRYRMSKREANGVVDHSFLPKGYAESLGKPLVQKARELHPGTFIKGLPGIDEDWDRHLPSVTSVHRNLTMKLGPEDHALVHDESVPKAQRARHLMGLMEAGGASMHWASQRGRAAAGKFGDHEFRSPGDTQVSVSADPPAREHVETDPERISKNGGYAYQEPDWEVPLKQGGQVNVTSVRWRAGNGGWNRHQFRDGHQFTAGQRKEAVVAHFEDDAIHLPDGSALVEGRDCPGCGRHVTKYKGTWWNGDDTPHDCDDFDDDEEGSGGSPFPVTAAAEYGPKPEYRAPPEHLSDDEKTAHFERGRKERHDWEAHIKRGLGLGHLDYDRARKLGYYGDGSEHPERLYDHEGNLKVHRGWQPLPHDLYHVTTDMPAVREHGLKSRAELGQLRGRGLGAGPDDTISLTSDHGTAQNILRAMHEHHDVVNGKKTPAQMVDEARAGHGADRPYLHEMATYSGEHWEDGEPMPRGLDAKVRGVELKRGGYLGTQKEMDEREGPGWRPHRDSDHLKGRDGETLYNSWERDGSPEHKREQASSLYRDFAVARAHAGGPEDPLFTGTDVHGFAAMDPSKFGIVHVHPRPGAQGFPVSSLNEWRTASGDALETHRAERLEHGHLKEAAVSRIAARFEPGFPNPHTGGDEWFHGTQSQPGDFVHGFSHNDSPSHDEEEMTGHLSHWNTLLGSHFAADHGVAEHFARQGASTDDDEEDWGGGDPGSRYQVKDPQSVIHARLHLRNPKHYDSEFDMDHEAYEHEYGERKNYIANHFRDGYEDEDPHGGDYEPDTTPGGEEWPLAARYRHDDKQPIPREQMQRRTLFSNPDMPEMPERTRWLNSHPDKAGIAARFKAHLTSQGHDGILYGNEFEDGHATVIGNHPGLSAITFHPGQTEITQHHQEGEPCLSHEAAEHQRARMPQPGQEELPGVEEHADSFPNGFLRGHAVVAHFEEPRTAAGPYMQQKLFHMQPDPTMYEPGSGRHNPADPEAHLRWRHEHDEGYEPDTCEQCGEDQRQGRRHGEQHEDWLRSQDWYTDWNEEHPGDTIHRGVGVSLPPEVHAVVHDESLPVAHRARTLAAHVVGGASGLGNFWSSDPDVSKTYAESSARRYSSDRPRTPVMLHAHTPGTEHFETDPETLGYWGVYSYHLAGNREVPLTRQAPVRLKGISWAPHGHEVKEPSPHDAGWHNPGPHRFDQDPAWTHHDFGEGGEIRAHASVAVAAAAEDPAVPSFTWKYQTYGPDGTYADREREVAGPFYHGSRSKGLRPGSQVKKGMPTNSWGDEGERSQYVHFTTSLEGARSYASRAGGHVYEVEPTGDDVKGGYSGSEWKSQKPLSVIRRVPDDELPPATAAVVAHFEEGPLPEYHGEPLYHGTRSILEPGEHLTVEEAERHPNNSDIQTDPYVHATTDPREAHRWGERADSAQAQRRMTEVGREQRIGPRQNADQVYRPRVYEVHPTGHVEPDLEYADTEHDSWRSAAPMRVKREVEPLQCYDCPDTGRNEEHWPDHPHYDYLRQQADEDDADREERGRDFGSVVASRNHWDMTEPGMRLHLTDEHEIANPGEDPASVHWGEHSGDTQRHVHPDLEREFVGAANPGIPQGDAFVYTPHDDPEGHHDPVFGSSAAPQAALPAVVAHFEDQYVAPPQPGEETWRHLQEWHGVKGDRTPGATFMNSLHSRLHGGQTADQGRVPHQHEEHGAGPAAPQAARDSISRMFTPIPAEELEAQRRAREPKPERTDDREYSLKDVSRHYGWEGFDSHEIAHLVHDPERATFTREDVPVHALRHVDEHGSLVHPPSYQDIAGEDDDERERLGELERGYDNGEPVPPIVTVRDGGHHIIADGSHRAAIHAERGSTHIPAFVTQRTIFPGQRTAAVTAAYDWATDEGPYEWDEIAQRHPRVYGDDEDHEPGMGEGGGEDIADAAAEMYHDRPSHPYSETTGELHPYNSDEMQFHPRTVDVNRIDYSRVDPGERDPRVERAKKGFQDHRQREKIPPLVLVHRHGVYHVADGHHRANGAAQAGWPSVRAYVAYSPHEDEPFAGRDGEPPQRGPFHGAEARDRPPMKDHNGDPARRISFPGFPHTTERPRPQAHEALLASPGAGRRGAVQLDTARDTVLAPSGPVEAVVQALAALGSWQPQDRYEAVAAARSVPLVFAALAAGLSRVAGVLEEMPLHPLVPDAVHGLAASAKTAAVRAEEALPPEASWETPGGSPNR